MSGLFSTDRTVAYRNLWAGICGLILVWSVAAQSAVGQDKASILERAEEVASFLELLDHENSIVRQMSIADGLASENQYIRDAAIEAGFDSGDKMVQKEAIAGVLKSKPLFMIEVPVQLDEQFAASSFAKWWSIARLEVTSEFFDPDSFSVKAESGRSASYFNCVLRMNEVLCRSTKHEVSFVLKPGVLGTLTGSIDSGELRLPIVIRNF